MPKKKESKRFRAIEKALMKYRHPARFVYFIPQDGEFINEALAALKETRISNRIIKLLKGT